MLMLMLMLMHLQGVRVYNGLVYRLKEHLDRYVSHAHLNL